MSFPTRYNANKRGIDFSSDCGGESKTQQSFRDECDINAIMRRYLSTGTVPTNVKVGRYGDFSSVPDYQESLHILENAREQFAALPASVRFRFKNNPMEMLEFVSQESNREEARKLGLLREEAKPPPAVVEPTK